MENIKVSYSFSKGYLMIGGTLLVSGIAGMLAAGLKLNKSLTIIASVAGLVGGAYLSIAALRKIENPAEQKTE